MPAFKESFSRAIIAVQLPARVLCSRCCSRTTRGAGLEGTKTLRWASILITMACPRIAICNSGGLTIAWSVDDHLRGDLNVGGSTENSLPPVVRGRRARGGGGERD